MKPLALAAVLLLCLTLHSAHADDLGQYAGSFKFPRICAGGESAEIVLANSGAGKLPGHLEWKLYDICGPNCYATYTQPFEILPGRSISLQYTSKGGLSWADVWIYQGFDVQALSGYRKSDTCEAGL